MTQLSVAKRQVLTVALCAAFLSSSAFAQAGRLLHLAESEPFDIQTTPFIEALPLEKGLGGAVANSASHLPAEALEFGSFKEEGDEAGCRVDPASPAIGADVPLTYFGVPSPGTNPSLVGAVQLLTSGPVDTAARTMTMPLYVGELLTTGETVWYIATDSTDQVNAAALGINHSAKLAFSETGDGTRSGARNATLSGDGVLTFDHGRVDFSPVRQVVPGAEPHPFPPTVAQPGAVGDRFYTPLVKVVNAGGHIYNLPTMAIGPAENLLLADGAPNYDFVHDSVLAIDFENETVTLALAAGFSFGRPVLYLSTDSNSNLAAALEGATVAPALNVIDVGNDDSLFSAVERIFITANGPRGCNNPQRQGLNAAVADGEAPFNVLGGIPTIAPDYSPLWDANVGQWTQEAIDAGYRSRLIDEFQILSFVEFGFLTGLFGAEYGSTGVIINCPIVHRFL